jgi:tRNA G18 (ribose-2'-O)-methylase SpoU
LSSWRSLLADIERTGTRLGRERGGLCSIEGLRLHERALRAGVRLEGALASASFLVSSTPRARRLLDDLAREGVEPLEAPDEVLASLTEGRGLGAIVGLARIPEPPTLELALERSVLARPVLLGAVGIADPGNTGALVRTAHASGASAFLTTPPTDAWHPRALRTSMGSAFKLAILEHADSSSLLDALAAAGVRTCAAVSSGGVALPACTFEPGPWCVLLGGEAFGMSEDVRVRVTREVTVPMVPGVDSLSASAAAAVLLYAVAHGRPLAPGPGPALG